jgi:hypothetical protein
MCEPYNLEYGCVEGFHAPEPDPIAPLMELPVRRYDDQTRRQLAKGFSLVKKYRSFMDDPKQKELREYAKPKADDGKPNIEGETQSKTEDLAKVKEGQGTAVGDNPTASPNQHGSSRSQAPSPPSCRNTPAEDLAGLNLGELTEAEGTSSDPDAADVV